jgi:hypothetical protein
MSRRSKTARQNTPPPAGAQSEATPGTLPQDAIDAVRVKLRRRAEAGATLGHKEWEGWPVLVQNIWLEELDRIRRWQIALLAKAVVSELAGGHLAEDMVYEDLPDEAQADILQRRAQDDTIARMTPGLAALRKAGSE